MLSKGACFVAALVVAASFSACGGGGNEGTVHDVTQVIDLFQKRTGELLVRGATDPDTYTTLNFADAQDDTGGLTDEGFALADKYGAFTIYVADDAAGAEGLLEDEDGNPREPDNDGLYWEHQSFGGGIPTAWGVQKRYDNVVLYWQGSEKKETDRTFVRLDSILQELNE